MGFDIYVYGTKELAERHEDCAFKPELYNPPDHISFHDCNHEIAYLGAYMGAFRMLYEQGYDWFGLIDAYDCDGGISGNGNSKYIQLADLEKALRVLNEFDPKGRLSSEGRDEFSHRKPILQEFMGKCIKWCKENNKSEIYIYFG